MKNNRTGLTSIKRQAGWTFWSMAFTLSVLMFFAYVGMQLVPVYSANNNIQNAINLSVEGSDLRSVNRTEIIKRIRAQLYLDGSHKLLDFKNDLKVTRSRNRFVVEVIYQRKVPLFGNLSVTADFNPSADCDLNGRCNE